MTAVKYRCKSAYKLVELDDKFHIFRDGGCRTVLDLAAAPGGFSEVALQRMNAATASAKQKSHTAASSSSSPSFLLPPLVVAIDQRTLAPLDGLVSIRCDVLDQRRVLQHLRPHLDGAPRRSLDLVLHDGVSVVPGQAAFSVTYAQGQMALSSMQLAAHAFTRYPPRDTTTMARDQRRRPTRWFVTKLMRSPHAVRVESVARTLFDAVEVHKPAACRPESQETYLVARGFREREWQAHRRGQRAGLFSLAPGPQDVRGVQAVVWCCLDCGSSCVGAQPCPHCTPGRKIW